MSRRYQLLRRCRGNANHRDIAHVGPFATDQLRESRREDQLKEAAWQQVGLPRLTESGLAALERLMAKAVADLKWLLGSYRPEAVGKRGR